MSRILRYLKGTVSKGLTYTSETNLISAYADASYVTDMQTGSSTSGIIIKSFGDTITWISRRQKVKATSTTEAEYVAMSEATKEIMWLQDMYKELGIKCQQPAVIYEDNSSAIALAKTENCSKLKHLASKYHLIRRQVMKNKIKLVWISTHVQPADVLTKPLPKIKFEEFRMSLMNESSDSVTKLKRKTKLKSDSTVQNKRQKQSK